MMSAIFVTACEAPEGRTALFFALEIDPKKTMPYGLALKLPKNDDEHRFSWPCARGLGESSGTRKSRLKTHSNQKQLTNLKRPLRRN
jgi:hypothetical protein